jgi:hypothetical protein
LSVIDIAAAQGELLAVLNMQLHLQEQESKLRKRLEKLNAEQETASKIKSKEE